MIKYIISITIIIFFGGCQNNRDNVKVFGDQNRTNKHFVSYISNKPKEDSAIQAKIKEKQLELQTQIEVEKIKAKQAVEVATIKSKTSKDIAKTDANTKIATTKLDVEALKEKSKMTLYSSIAFAVVFVIAIIVYYLNSRKNRELKEKLHQQEMIQRQKELEEKRLHKMLDLIADGKVSKDIEKEVLLTMTRSNIKLLS